MKIQFDKDYIIETTYDYSPMRKGVYSITKVEELEGRELSQAEEKKRIKLGLPSFKRVKLTKEEKIVKVTREYKKLFNKGDTFELKKGVNILVGDNGCGKSTLIKKLVKKYKNKLSIIHIDMEKANPTISKPEPEKGFLNGYSPQEIMAQWMWAMESHGETREGVLASILGYECDLMILDEPEQGLSLRNQLKYLNKLKEMDRDMIIITHSKVFVENVGEVFDVEQMKWIESKEYLSTCT